ncbi:MAG: hypothetical protein JXB47_04705 [Anaerolineae bacterium]|nr:hypothetical protein [Anaerolineae bacterium]
MLGLILLLFFAGTSVVVSPEPAPIPTVAAITRVPTPTPIPAPAVQETYILASCDEFNQGTQYVTEGSRIMIHWGWFAKTQELLEDHIEHATYEISLDGQPLIEGDWRALPSQSFIEDGYPTRVWYIELGELPAGTYRVGYRLAWDAAIDDGFEKFGPGTENEAFESGCTFVVGE